MSAGIVLGCYAIASLITARLLYGRWRAKGIDANAANFGYTTDSAIDSWNEIDRGPVMAGAFGLGLLWPLVPVFILLIRFMDSAPQVSQAELCDRLRERNRRIADLERELGLPRRPS
jgi:hypothetical protein